MSNVFKFVLFNWKLDFQKSLKHWYYEVQIAQNNRQNGTWCIVVEIIFLYYFEKQISEFSNTYAKDCITIFSTFNSEQSKNYICFTTIQCILWLSIGSNENITKMFFGFRKMYYIIKYFECIKIIRKTIS